jgi:hypothetical protein
MVNSRNYDPINTGSTIHETRPDASSSPWAAHSNTTVTPFWWVTCHLVTPVEVHGQCQPDLDITSGETSLRPAAHMSVKSWHSAQ